MKKILLTIDTEGPTGNDPILYQIWGKVGPNDYYGISKIIEICDNYGIKGLFFVDIPEIWDLGYEKIRDVILYIRDKGHDVGMHIHPHHMPDENRHFLFDYSKEEQRQIIIKCTDKFKEICGEYPKSFRAGKYGANLETLDIIAELGYKYDFSEFYSNKWCGISPEIAYVLPQRYKSLIELPVTVFRSCNLFGYERFDKLEVTNDYRESYHIIKKYTQTSDDGVIILFMHSFSLINFRFTPNAPTLNKKNLYNFKNLLDKVSKLTTVEYISEKDLSSVKISKLVDTKDNIVTTNGIHRQLYFTFLRAYEIRKYNGKAKLLFIGLRILLIIIVLIVFCLIFL